MRIIDAKKKIEEYYNAVYESYNDGNMGNYTVDDAYDKVHLEKIIKNDFVLDADDRDFLNNLIEDVVYPLQMAIKTILKKQDATYCFRYVLGEAKKEIILKTSLEDVDISQILDLLLGKNLSKIKIYLNDRKIKYSDLIIIQTEHTRILNDNYDYIYEIIDIKDEKISARYKHPDGEREIKRYFSEDKQTFIFKIDGKEELLEDDVMCQIPSHIYDFLLVLKLIDWISTIEHIKQIMSYVKETSYF